MSWREFSLRSMGYKRQELNEWRRTRETAFYGMIGSHLDPKKIPKTPEKFMPLADDVKSKPKITLDHKEAFLRQAELFYKKANGK